MLNTKAKRHQDPRTKKSHFFCHKLSTYSYTTVEEFNIIIQYTMKLQEYFTHQQDIHLSEAEKLDIYHSIMDKKAKKSFLTKRSILHIKTFTYSSFVVALLFGFYGIYFFQNQSLDGDAIIFNTGSERSLVQAGYIAKVVDFQGTFYIEKDGQTLQTSMINDGDVVVLQNKAQIVFHIDTGTQAKITGPAKFTIQKKAENAFRINLMYWDYVEMKSLQATQVQWVELSIDDILVSQSSKVSALNFQLIKEGGKHVIKNNGSKLIVMSQDSKKKTNVDKKQILAIQGNDVSLFDNFEKFAKAINNKDLSKTYSLVFNTSISEVANIVETPDVDMTGAIHSGNTGPILAALRPLAETEILSIVDIDIKDETTISDISAVVSSDKKIVSTVDQSNLLQNKFNPRFIEDNIQEVSLAYLWGSESFWTTFKNLESRVKQVADTFKIPYEVSKGTEKERLIALSNKLGDLRSSIEAKYFVAPKYLDNIQKTQLRVKYLTSQIFWQLEWSSNEGILNTIPSALKF